MTTATLSSIGDRLDAARRDLGMTWPDLAVATQMTEPILRRRLHRPAGMTLAELDVIARALDVVPARLFGEVGRPTELPHG
ncbi:helix-turn-helix transcriptional regulator [Agrococcus sp. SL85]|uniref:helix-turn-helix domain-containing protein n=1 Tax=Agrococcus sp. SL85 TaxID=2995141 RepID=UPI00226D34E3|nr:helix-turn-helix transcriptional regulator [Agrococcus sp. SL85]WAC65758.1 helix-turn-helix transcriptional regulator [Agrococcus sp. SL85]